MDILETYLNEVQSEEGVQYLSEDVLFEDIKSIVDKLKGINIKKIVSSLQSAAKVKDLDKIKSVFKSIKLPSIPVEKISAVFKKSSPNFEKSYLLSKKVIKNSIPKLPDKNVDAIAFAVAAKSTNKSNKPMDDTKDNLIKAVSQVRKYIGEGVGYYGSNLGSVIFVIYVIGSIIAATTLGASASILMLVGCLIIALKSIIE